MSTRRWLWALAALTVPALYACVDEDAGPTTITGRPALEVNMDFLAAGLPSGDANVPEPPVVDLDTVNNPTDLFGRGAPTRDPVFVQAGDLDIDKTTDWIAPRNWFDDPRLPRLIEHAWDDTYGDNIDWLEFQRPDGPTKIGRWDYRSDIDYVGDLDSWYAIGLVRYATIVNGLIDHLEILVYNGQVRQPDSLVLLGGSPGGYPDHQADFWTASGDYCPPVPANANPFIMGHFKTGPTVDPKDPGADFDGETDADFCFMGNGLWQAGYTDPLHPDSIPFAPNNLSTFNLPQYNYLVVWEYDRATNTVLYDRPVMRAQVGIELDLNGNPLPHAFAPFPAPPGHELSDFASYEEFLSDPRVTPGVTSLDMTVYNLEPLTGGAQYQVWLFDEVENDVVRVSATHTLQRPDTVGFDELEQPIIEWVDVAAPATVDGFDGAAGYRHVIQLRDADLAGAGIKMSQYTHAAITIGGTSDASPLDSPVPVCYRYTNQNETRADLTDNQIFVSGGVDAFCVGLAADLPAWKPFGAAQAEFLNVEGFALTLNRVARPPLGYYYGVWLLNTETGASLNLGEITTPPPEMASLRDADIQTGQWVSEGEIFRAGKWVRWADLPADVTTYNAVAVTLEPKAGDPDVMSTVMFMGAIPKDLDKLPKEKESG
jgi:hypothetical protein